MAFRHMQLSHTLKLCLTHQPYSTSITSKPTKEDIPRILKMVLAEKNDSTNKQISKFLSETFVKHEPVVIAAKLENTKEVQEYILGDVAKGRSLLIINPENKEIISAAVSTDTKPYTPQINRDYADAKVTSVNTKRLLYFWANILERAKLFDEFQTDKIWNISYLATSHKMQGQGLSRFLAHQSRLLAIDTGYSAIHMDCTNHFSAKIAKKIGLKALQEQKVDSYVDETGKPWIPTLPPHPHGNIVITGEQLPKKV